MWEVLGMQVSFYHVDLKDSFMEATAKLFYDPRVYNSTEPILTEVNSLLDDINASLKLLDYHNKSRSNEEYLTLLSRVAYLYLEEEDVPKILSQKYGQDFEGFMLLRTDMVGTVVCINQLLRSFWRKKHFVFYRVCYSTDANLDPEHFYSTAEIATLLAKHKIELVGIGSNLLTTPLETSESLHYFPITNIANLLNDPAFREYAIKYIRSNLKRRTIVRGIGRFIRSVDEEIAYFEYPDDKFQYEIDYGKKCLSDLETNGQMNKLRLVRQKVDEQRKLYL